MIRKKNVKIITRKFARTSNTKNVNRCIKIAVIHIVSIAKKFRYKNAKPSRFPNAKKSLNMFVFISMFQSATKFLSSTAIKFLKIDVRN